LRTTLHSVDDGDLLKDVTRIVRIVTGRHMETQILCEKKTQRNRTSEIFSFTRRELRGGSPKDMAFPMRFPEIQLPVL